MADGALRTAARRQRQGTAERVRQRGTLQAVDAAQGMRSHSHQRDDAAAAQAGHRRRARHDGLGLLRSDPSMVV